MTKLLEQLVAEVERRPEAEQDEIAARLLDQLRDDDEWDRRFAATSPAQFAAMAARARQQVAEGQVREAGIDSL